MQKRTRRFHGGVRGGETPHLSNSLDGRFGRMFRTLPPAVYSAGALEILANAMTSPAEPFPTPETEVDSEENSGIFAGYTYLGQFIDHDLTFDPMSSLIKQNDPEALTDFRTPRFDLDNLYGRGPGDQPYLYEDDGLHLQEGRPLTGSVNDPGTVDLPRHTSLKKDSDGTLPAARALIGDPRNDENVIVSQLQATMIRFHNKMVDLHPGASLAKIQQHVRWHYQWVVLHDFLPTIVGQDMVDSILPHLKSGKSIHVDTPKLRFYKFQKKPFIPIEFSVAAYRFGHSMVRPIYRLNTSLGKDPAIDPKDPNFNEAVDSFNGRLMIFDAKGDDFSLTGFREFPSVWAVDWSLFFDFGNDAPAQGVNRIQHAYKIDTSLVNPLGSLPKPVGNPSAVTSLAGLNLLRGLRMGLPSGQSVARAMGVPVIDDTLLKVGKATSDDAAVFTSIVDIPTFGGEFIDNAPLWFYILAEAQQAFVDNDTPLRLGPVGGRIVAETFIGLLLGDSHSFLSQSPEWKPKTSPFKMADLIKLAIAHAGVPKLPDPPKKESAAQLEQDLVTAPTEGIEAPATPVAADTEPIAPAEPGNGGGA
jgi:hypothetical protein